MNILKNYQEGANLTLLNTTYIYPKRQEDGKYDDGKMIVLFKDNDMDKIQKRIRNLINSLSSCGLTASQTSNEDLRIILDNFLNGGQTTEFGTVVAL